MRSWMKTSATALVGLLVTLIALIGAGLEQLVPERPPLPAVVKWNQHAFAKRTYGKAIAGGGSAWGAFVGAMRSVARIFVTIANAPLRFAGYSGPMLQSGHAVLPLPADVKPRYESYVKLATEAHKLQEEWKGKEMPQNIGEDLEAKLKEAETIWNGEGDEKGIGEAVEKAEQQLKINDRLGQAIHRRNQFDRVMNTVPNPTMPAADSDDRKGVAGFITLGDFVVAHEIYRKAGEAEFRGSFPISQIPASLIDPTHFGRGVKGRDGRPVPLIALDAMQRKAFDEFFAQVHEMKATPTIGAGVIEPQRLDIIPQVTADDRLRIRDVLQLGQTNSSSVSYVREDSFTRAAAETAAGSAKPEATANWTEQTANVRTIPVWMPVTTEQLADWPQLRGLIDNRLLYDVRKREEEQIMYGTGTGQNLEGILVVSGTQDITADADYDAANDDLEHIRLGVTLVMVAGYEANAVLIHPRDWWSIIVAKGTDDHYLGQVFMTADRAPRVWGINIVETIAAEQNAGNPTEERNYVVGDFIRGCALIDRMQANVMVGLNSDDFTTNKRTILAEERVAFPIYAPAAFATKETKTLAT